MSCCQHEGSITGKPACHKVRPTGSEWHTAQPTETAHWGKTACPGVCSVLPHHQGKHKEFSPNAVMFLIVLVFNFHFSLSFCPYSFRYQLLHNDIQSSVFVTETPDRVGTLLDYQLGRLSFYNAQSGQLLGTFRQNFTQPCQPALALELPGSLELSMVPVVPEFTKDS